MPRAKPHIERSSFERRHGPYAAAGVGLLALGVYVATLYPSVPGGDSGELIVAADTLASAHPSGYPLYVLLAKVFTWLPFNSVAWRVNAFSAACAAGAASLLTLIVGRITRNPWAGVAAGGVFAFSPTVWIYATSAEVFALNNLLIALQLYLAARAWAERDVKFAYALAFTVGLGMTNHLTSGVTGAISLAAIVWHTRERWKSLAAVLRITAALAAGLLPYLWLPIASASETPSPVQWGDQTTLQGFLDHVLRRDYGTFRLAAASFERNVGTAGQLAYYARDAIQQLAWVGAPLAAWGVYRGLRDSRLRAAVVVSLVAWSVFLLVFHSLANLPLDDPLVHGVVARFWQQPHLFASAWLGIGLAALMPRSRGWIASAAVALVGWQIAVNVGAVDHHRDWTIHDFGASILQPLPERALVLTRGDLISNTARYLHAVEGVRPDLRIADQEMLTFKWMKSFAARQMPDVVLPGDYYHVSDRGAYSMRQLVDANIDRRPIVLCPSVKDGDTSLDATYDQWPLGACSEVLRKGAPVDVAEWLRRSESALPNFRSGISPTPPPADSWERVVWVGYWDARHRRGTWLLTWAIARGDTGPLYATAAAIFDDLIERHPSPPPPYFKNSGIAYGRLSVYRPDLAPKAVERLRQYVRNVAVGDPELPTIEKAIVELEGMIR